MDFFNFARAAEQMVYETASWLYFYPATLLKVLFRPFKMMDYAGQQTLEPPETQFSGAMRPALLLFISILIGATAVPLHTDETQLLPQTLRDSWPQLIVFRFMSFGIFPMAAAIMYDLFTPGEVTRQSLKKPFNQQAYIYAPFSLIVSPALVMVGRDGSMGMWLAIVGIILWVLIVETAFFRRAVGFSYLKSFATALCSFIIAIVVNHFLQLAVLAM